MTRAAASENVNVAHASRSVRGRYKNCLKARQVLAALPGACSVCQVLAAFARLWCGRTQHAASQAVMRAHAAYVHPVFMLTQHKVHDNLQPTAFTPDKLVQLTLRCSPTEAVTVDGPHSIATACYQRMKLLAGRLQRILWAWYGRGMGCWQGVVQPDSACALSGASRYHATNGLCSATPPFPRDLENIT